MKSILAVFTQAKKYEKSIDRYRLRHNFHALFILAILLIFCCALFLVQVIFFPNELRYPWLTMAYIATFGSGALVSLLFALLMLAVRNRVGRRLNHSLMGLYAFLVVTFGTFITVLDCYSSPDMTALFVATFAVCMMLSGRLRAYLLLVSWVSFSFLAAFIVILSHEGNQGLPFTVFFLAISSLVTGVYFEYSRLRTHVLSIQLENTNSALKESMIRDPLTGAYNRIFLDEFLDKQKKAMKRYGEFMALLLVDLDFFKRVNDSLGHLTGDIVLKKVVEILSKNIRDSDIISRFGGEEFIIALPRTNYTNALKLAEKLRRMVAETAIEGVPWHITVSIGVGTLSVDESMETAFARIDAALYVAKRNGRNRVEGMESERVILDSIS